MGRMDYLENYIYMLEVERRVIYTASYIRLSQLTGTQTGIFRYAQFRELK